MFQTSIDNAQVKPGHVYEWRLVAPDTVGAPRAMGYNQTRHFATAKRLHQLGTRLAFSIAGTFDLPGLTDLDALEAALLHFLRRHEVLRSHYQSTPVGTSCTVGAPEEISVERVEKGRLDSAVEVNAHLRDTLTRVDTLTGPWVILGAVVRDYSATVYFCFDHLVADTVSAAIATADIASAYEALVEGRCPDSSPAGSYLEFNRTQLAHNEAIDADARQLDQWKGFIASNGGLYPRFPLELRIEPGCSYQPVNQTHLLLSSDEADALESRCRQARCGMFTGVLAAVATALRDEGGPDLYRGHIIVNEREHDHYAGAMGWFINTLPVEIPVPRDLDFTGLVAEVSKAYATAHQYIDLHHARAWELLELDHSSNACYWPYPLNLFSYLDFRKMPGADRDAARNTKIYMGLTRSTGLLHWVFRNDAGLHLNCLYADTPQARSTMTAWTRRLTQTLRDFAAGQ